MMVLGGQWQLNVPTDPHAQPVSYPQGEGDVSPSFHTGGQSCKSTPHFFTHNDALAGFKSQSLGLGLPA